MRSDIRLLGERGPDEEYDTEVKVPVETAQFQEVRAIVPRRKPWFYRIITSFMQRLINSYVSRTSSPPPNLILVGGTGTQAYLPFYEGVPSISVPALHKIDEQLSTENMVGVVVIRVLQDGDRIRIVERTYNLKPIVSKEREFVVPEVTTRIERLVLTALKRSPASFGTLKFRVTELLKKSRHGREKEKQVTDEKLQAALETLLRKRIVVYRKNSNWYAINDKKRAAIQVSLRDILKNSKTVTHFIISCVHTGAIKSLNRTFLCYVPQRAWDADAFFEVGDPTQDLAHQYEYTGEVYPSLLTPDKQELMAGAMRAVVMLKILKRRLKEWIGDAVVNMPLEVLLRKVLITYVFTAGNHPGWKAFRKGALILQDFECQLKQTLIKGIIEILSQAGRKADFETVSRIVNEKVIRVGENGIVVIDGVCVGVKHPSKARTESKSHRIQDVVSFLWRTFNDLVKRTAKKTNSGFALVYIANFHEMAAVYVSKFGKMILGVMSGAYLKDTLFETSKDKVVDYGFAKVTAVLTPEGELIRSDIEFDNYMLPEDAEFVFADKLMTSAVISREEELTKILDLPWRLK
jgi:hypothetical protein